MSRIAIIETCDDCPYFDNVYYAYKEKCTKLNRQIDLRDEGKGILQTVHEIPEDCPLPESHEVIRKPKVKE